MVAQVSKHNADYIMKQMSYAHGLQFRTAYWQSKGIKLASDDAQPGLENIIQ
jgi:hypothetical protein